MSLSMLKEPSKSYIFQNSPTIQQMKGNREYRKTLRYYRGALEDGMMVMLEDLEGFPAPVLCSSCEKPVITQTKTERSGYQWFLVGWTVITTAGILTYPIASTNKSIVHLCPACEHPLATRAIQMSNSGVNSETRVHKYYSATVASGKGGNGHTAKNFQVNGYSKVQIGDQ